MQATNAPTLFQTDEALAQGAARALKASRTASGSEYGHPIWLGGRYKDSVGLVESGAGADAGSARVLSLRCRTVALSPAAAASADGAMPESQAWTAESGGVVRVTDLENGKTAALYRGHMAPVPTFDIVQASAPASPASGVGKEAREVLVTGSWDKSIKVWPIPSRSIAAPSIGSLQPKPILTHPRAASDFIKAVHGFRSEGRDFLLSAGSDKTVRCWHLTPLLFWIRSLSDEEWTQICTKGISEEQSKAVPDIEVAATMREHTRPINCLASVPPPPHLDAEQAGQGQATLFSADSMGRMFEMVLDLPSSSTLSTTATTPAPPPPKGSLTIRRELRAHETAIYDLRLGWRDEEIEGLDSLPSPSPSASAGDDFVTPVYEAGNGSFRRYVAEVWTCSGDKTARCFVLSPTVLRERGQGETVGSRSSKAGPVLGSQPPLAPVLTVTHGDFVKSLVPLLHAGAKIDVARQAPTPPNLLATGSADETLRLFSPDESSHDHKTITMTTPVAAVEGHWHEIDAMDAWFRPGSGPLGPDTSPSTQPSASPSVVAPRTSVGGEWYIVSSGLDGSIRRWNVQHLLHPPAKPPVQSEATTTTTTTTANVEKTVKQVATGPTVPPFTAKREGFAKKGTTKPKQDLSMTEEEERELAELMGSDNDL